MRCALIEKVHVIENWQTGGHQVVVVGRPYADAKRGWLDAEGEWREFSEVVNDERNVGFRLPEGVLDAIVAAYQGVTAPSPAIERHLDDAVAVRDRLLTLVEGSGGVS